MKQIATVEKLLPGGRVQISVARQSACAHDCGECAGCGGTPSPVFAEADNPVGAVPGQKVVVESSTKGILKIAMLVYAVPFLMFFLAYFLTPVGDSAIRAFAGFVAFALGVLLAVLYDRRMRRSGGMIFTIVRVF